LLALCQKYNQGLQIRLCPTPNLVPQKHLVPIPSTAETMATYADYLSEDHKSATIHRRINRLGAVLKLSKNHDPTKQPQVMLALKRMHRKIGRSQEKATPLTKILLN
jgi:hypothetical protein